VNKVCDWAFEVSALDLIALIDRSIEESENREFEFSERLAIQFESRDAEQGTAGMSTTERAKAALQRGERFPGEHAVARGWLRENAE